MEESESSKILDENGLQGTKNPKKSVPQTDNSAPSRGVRTRSTARKAFTALKNLPSDSGLNGTNQVAEESVRIVEAAGKCDSGASGSDGESDKRIQKRRSSAKGAKKGQKSRPRNKFPCKICGKPYTRFYMDAHMRLHSGEKPFCCQEQGCKRQFATEYYLRMHAQRCHGEPQCYPCDVCHRKLASKRGLLEHRRIHSEERPFACKLCGKGFRQPALLFNHVKTHDAALPFQCEQCGMRYKYKRSMERHKEKIHEGVLHSFPCKRCSRTFSTKSKLKEHQYVHEGNSPHVCQVCGKRLLARKTLQNHMLIHQGEKPYRCEVCGKPFRFLIVLKRHLSVHTGVKPFRCDKCGRQFIHRVYMDRHKCAAARAAVARSVDLILAGELGESPLTGELETGTDYLDDEGEQEQGATLEIYTLDVMVPLSVETSEPSEFLVQLESEL